MAKTGAKGAKGTLIQRSVTEGGPYTTIPEARDITLTPPSQTYEDATHQESPGDYAEQVPILKENGSASFEINFKPSDSVQSDLEGDQESQSLRYWRIAYPQFERQYEFEGYVSQFDHQAPVRGILRANVTIQVTGEVTRGAYVP